VTIRCATVADIPAMRAVEASAATAAHWTPETYDSLFRPDSLRRLMLVLEDSNGIIGFVVALCCAAEWEIENLAVAHEARRRGVGNRLVGELLAQAEKAGANAVLLEVRESNQAARAMYEKCGFLESGRRSRYYSDPLEDAILYRLSALP
jgi:ribosomal-protein-alanine N-acetyltransferase